MQNKMNRFIFYGEVQLISTNGQREGKKRLSFSISKMPFVRHRGTHRPAPGKAMLPGAGRIASYKAEISET